MNEFKEIASICNFTMLPQRLYSLFIQYICNGRKRAPPENDLRCLKSTFQLGAKTDRRAVQSKFKSWAKRMTVKDYKLKLLSTGKEIIPLEKCCEVVMSVHSDAHLSIERVMVQIQEKYTWTKKNFGMDKRIVTECILKNCSSSDCRQQIENEINKRHCVENFIREVILASESPLERFQNQRLSSSFTASNAFMNAPLHPWPMLLPMPSEDYNPYIYQDDNGIIKILPRHYCFVKEKNNDHCMEQESNTSKNISPIAENEKKLISRKPKRVLRTPGVFRKPKNMQDFLVLMRAAELSPETNPSILKEEKTKFLGCLGLVPRMICSKRTLMKFEKEKKRKRVIERQHMMYNNNRKNLRDRNKLNKVKFKEQREKRAYLEIARRQTGSKPEKSHFGSEKSVRKDENGEGDPFPQTSQKNVTEIIEISSSDEDNSISPMKIYGCQTKKLLDRCNVEKSNNSDDLIVIDSNSINSRKIANISRPKEQGTTIRKINEQTQNARNILYSKTESCHHSKLKPCFIPTSMTRDVAVLQSSQNISAKPLICYKPPPQISNNHATNKSHVNKLLTGKNSYPILQPISNVMKLKTTNRYRLLAPRPVEKTREVIDISRLKNIKKNITHFSNERLTTTMKTKVPDCSKKFIDRENILRSPEKFSNLLLLQQNRERSQNILEMQKDILDHREVSCRNKLYIDYEMSRLSELIQIMKSSMARSMCSFNVQKSSQKLVSQLNTGIALVRNIRRKLYELEKLETQTISPRLY